MVLKKILKNKKVHVVSIFFTILFLFGYGSASAATLKISSSSGTISSGDKVTLNVILNSEGVAINNAEATIKFSPEYFDVLSVSRSGSIFSLWVEEPYFSNSSGVITFNGGVPTPGFNGSQGPVMSITVKAKKVGQADFSFSNAAVRANDGLGTDVLTSKSNSTLQINTPLASVPVEVTPTTVPTITTATTLPIKPVIISTTHSDQNTWYSSNTASFNWKVPSGVNQVQAILNKTAIATPNISYDSSVTQKTLSDLKDGVYYFHLRYRNTNGWGTTAHYQVNIDTTKPLDFNPTIRTEDNQNYIKLNAEDSVSGISYYLLAVDENVPIKVKETELIGGEYLLPILNQGNHELVVSAYDKAGNYKDAKLEFKSSFISVPTISLSSEEIHKGEAVVVLGKTDYPNNKVEITLSLEGEILKKYIQNTDIDGSFSLTTDRIKNIGLINIWAENIFSNNVKSKPSQALTLKVNEPIVIKVTFALLWVILFLILVLILLFIAYEGWHKFFGLRKKINRELNKTADDTHKALMLFKDELSEQLKVLEKTKIDRTLNKKEEAIFTEIEKNVDHIDEFIKKKLNR